MDKYNFNNFNVIQWIIFFFSTLFVTSNTISMYRIIGTNKMVDMNLFHLYRTFQEANFIVVNRVI